MIILDSNVWIAFLNKKDSLHQKAQEVFQSLSGKIILPEYVILEISTVLLQKVDKQTADLFLDMVTNNDDVEILFSDQYFFTNLIDFFVKFSEDKLSFVDISLLYLSKSYQVVTFDDNLNKIIDITFKK